MKTVKDRIYLYHNKRCSKSRLALEYLNKNNISCIIIDYLNEKLDKELLKKTLLMLKGEEVIRKNEKIYKNFSVSEDQLNPTNNFDLIVKYPILLQRPIIVKEIDHQVVKALICRPVELIKTFI